MSAILPIPTSVVYSPCGTRPYYSITTAEPGSLHLWVFARKPSLLYNIFYHRGSPALKRYYYSADFIACLSELTLGPNFVHMWQLPTAPIGTTYWLVWADSCDPHYATVTSIPIEYVYTACPAGVDFLSRTIAGDIVVPLAGGWLLANADVLLDGNPSLQVSQASMKNLNAGPHRASFYGTFKGNIAPISSGVRISTSQPGQAIIATQTFTIPADAVFPFQISADWNPDVPNRTVSFQFFAGGPNAYTLYADGFYQVTQAS